MSTSSTLGAFAHLWQSKTGSHFTQRTADVILKAFEDNPKASINQIAKIVGKSRKCVWDVKVAYGMKSGKPGHYTPEKQAYVVSLIRKHVDKSDVVIAALCGCARDTVYRLRKKFGIAKATSKGGKPMKPSTVKALDHLVKHPNTTGPELYQFGVLKRDLPWLRKKTGLAIPSPRGRQSKREKIRNTIIGEL